MNLILKREIEKTFLQTVRELRTEIEIARFLCDLMGQTEFDELVKKLAIVYWLRKKRSGEVIKNNLDATNKEIAEVEKLMDKKGIKLAIKYLEAEEFANTWSEKIKKFTKVVK